MSDDRLGNTTRRGFLGTATAATAVTLTAPPAAEAGSEVRPADKTQMAQLTTEQNVDTSNWSQAVMVPSFPELLQIMALQSSRR
jgi:hypothetical protein